MADMKYRDSSPGVQVTYSNDRLDCKWIAREAKFERPRVKMTAEQKTKLEDLLSDIEDNTWVKAYHYDKSTVGLCLIVLGILLLVVVVGIVLIIMGIWVLASKDGYYVFCFQKMLNHLTTFNDRKRDSLRSSGFSVYLEHRKGRNG